MMDSKNTKQLLKDVWVDIPEDEAYKYAKIFSITGMKSAFLSEYSSYKRGRLDYALSNKSCKKAMLMDLRQFVETHAEELEEIVRDLNAYPEKKTA